MQYKGDCDMKNEYEELRGCSSEEAMKDYDDINFQYEHLWNDVDGHSIVTYITGRTFPFRKIIRSAACAHGFDVDWISAKKTWMIRGRLWSFQLMEHDDRIKLDIDESTRNFKNRDMYIDISEVPEAVPGKGPLSIKSVDDDLSPECITSLINGLCDGESEKLKKLIDKLKNRIKDLPIKSIVFDNVDQHTIDLMNRYDMVKRTNPYGNIYFEGSIGMCDMLLQRQDCKEYIPKP